MLFMVLEELGKMRPQIQLTDEFCHAKYDMFIGPNQSFDKIQDQPMFQVM